MSWQRKARIGAALVGLGSAAALFLLTRPRPPVEPGATLAPLDSSVAVQAKGGTFVRSRGDTVLFQMKYAGSTQSPDGHMRFDQAQIAFEDGRFAVSADVVETRATPLTSDRPAQVDLKGHVHLVSTEVGDDLTLSTDAATYDDAADLVTIPGEVTFSRGRLSGHGVGATFNRAQDLFQLLDQATVDVESGAPTDPGGGSPVAATAKSMTLARAEKFMRLEEHATIDRATEKMAADVATLYFTDDEKQIKLVDLHGGASVTPVPGATDPPPAMAGDTISLALYPDGAALQRATITGHASMVLAGAEGRRSIDASWIDALTAPDGRTLTRLEGRQGVVVHLPKTADAPARTISAASLVASGEPSRGLQSALFDGGVTFVETVPPARGRGTAAATRTATSKALILVLDGDLDAVRQADFRQNVVFTSGTTSAKADRAQYDAPKSMLLLCPQVNSCKATPHVEDDSVDVYAAAIDLSLDTSDLSARGDVKATMKGGNRAGGGRASALFDDSQPIRGFGSELHYTSASKRAKYLGGPAAQARVVQNESQILGDEIELDETTGNLTATGQVRSTFRLDDAATTTPAGTKTGSAQPTLYRVNGDVLVYDDATRLATYTGAPANLKSADADVTAATIAIRIAQESRTVEAFDASGDVFATLDGGREARGRTLAYVASTTIYALTGAPLKLKVPNEDGSGCVLFEGTYAEYNRTSGAAVFPQARNPAGSRQDQIACSASIR
jgi:lipopolysaccharide export system protein LptA